MINFLLDVRFNDVFTTQSRRSLFLRFWAEAIAEIQAHMAESNQTVWQLSVVHDCGISQVVPLRAKRKDAMNALLNIDNVFRKHGEPVEFLEPLRKMCVVLEAQSKDTIGSVFELWAPMKNYDNHAEYANIVKSIGALGLVYRSVNIGPAGYGNRTVDIDSASIKFQVYELHVEVSMRFTLVFPHVQFKMNAYPMSLSNMDDTVCIAELSTIGQVDLATFDSCFYCGIPVIIEEPSVEFNLEEYRKIVATMQANDVGLFCLAPMNPNLVAASEKQLFILQASCNGALVMHGVVSDGARLNAICRPSFSVVPEKPTNPDLLSNIPLHQEYNPILYSNFNEPNNPCKTQPVLNPQGSKGNRRGRPIANSNPEMKGSKGGRRGRPAKTKAPLLHNVSSSSHINKTSISNLPRPDFPTN